MHRLQLLPNTAPPPSPFLEGGGGRRKKDRAPPNVTDPELYLRIKREIWSEIRKNGKQNWGAYHSGMLVRRYKAEFSKKWKDQKSPYRGQKNTSLSRWYKEKWIDACKYPQIRPCGRHSAKSGKLRYCRPLNRVSPQTPKTVKELSSQEINRRCAQKSAGKRVTTKRVKSSARGRKTLPFCDKISPHHRKGHEVPGVPEFCIWRGTQRKMKLPRKFSRAQCEQGPQKGFSRKASCSVYTPSKNTA